MPKQSGFEAYTKQLEALAIDRLRAESPGENLKNAVTVALDGGSSAALRRIVPIDKRRELGAYFTPSSLANETVQAFQEDVPTSVTFMDSACGAGDLLLAAARLLPVRRTLSETLAVWNTQLVGFDLREEFVRAAKVRLLLLAIERGCTVDLKSIPPNTKFFPLLTNGNGLDDTVDYTGITHITINPSFSKQNAPEGCTWATEKVSSAAVFLYDCVSRAIAGTKIVAILPDVLRSGSNYSKWRSEIVKRATIEEVKIIGTFDRWTDVDVFLIRLTVGTARAEASTQWWNGLRNSQDMTIGDRFEVEVGRVVPHRDLKKGPWWPYIYSRVVPQWQTVREFPNHRRFAGKVFRPPFVVVRRTSRPGDQYRAVGSVICGKKKVAVENHLM
ncbi:MAG TPA: N-6 DNA methylase, partial [Pyrinomonadaceae bacterium]|nr:N-6 DNA methylase [Pyrinomonadaceae bacterium]